MDSGDDTIYLVQLSRLFEDSQPTFIYVNCMYHTWNPMVNLSH